MADGKVRIAPARVVDGGWKRRAYVLFTLRLVALRGLTSSKLFPFCSEVHFGVSMTDDQEYTREYAARLHERHRQVVENTSSLAAESGIAAVKALLLLNGGASVALLAFSATVATSENPLIEPSRVFDALALFAIGSALAVAAACGTYLTNYCYAASGALVSFTWTWPFVQDTRKGIMWFRVGYAFHGATVVVAFASLALFLAGVFLLRSAFG